MNREQAHEILMKYMKGENYIVHSYAVEAIMKGLAKRLAPGEEEYWGIAGLLHDLDEEQCDWQNDMSVHGPTSVEILKKEGIDKVSLIAFTSNDVGNTFWQDLGWEKREDINYYDFTLNGANKTTFNQ